MPESTIAGGAVVTATNSDGTEAATPLAIGVQQVPYTESTNANGVGLYFYPKAQYSESGVPFVLATAVVQSPNVGNINTIELVDESGNLITGQYVTSGNSGAGATQLTMGSVVQIVVPLPQGINLSQNYKVRTSYQSAPSALSMMAEKLGLSSKQAQDTSNETTGSQIYTLITQGNNINLQFTPNQVYLTGINPIQFGYLYNIGDLTASQIQVSSSSPNVRVTAADQLLDGQRVIKVTYELINTTVAPTTNLVTVTANNPAGQTQISTAETNQNVNPLPVPTPTPTPEPTPAPSGGLSISTGVVDGVTFITLTNNSDHDMTLGQLSFSPDTNLYSPADNDHCSNTALTRGSTCVFRLAPSTAPLSNVPFVISAPITSSSTTPTFNMVINAKDATSFDMSNSRYVLVRYMWANGDVDIQFGINGASPNLVNNKGLYQYMGFDAIHDKSSQVSCVLNVGPTNDSSLCYGDSEPYVYQSSIINWSGDNTTGGEEDIIFDKNEFLAAQGGNYAGHLWLRTAAAWYYGPEDIPSYTKLTVKFELYPDGTSFAQSEDAEGNTVWTANAAPTSTTYAMRNLTDAYDSGQYTEMGPIYCAFNGSNMTTCNFPGVATVPAKPSLATNNFPNPFNPDLNDNLFITFNSGAMILNNPFIWVSSPDGSDLTISKGDPSADQVFNLYCDPLTSANGQCLFNSFNWWCDYSGEQNPDVNVWLGGEHLGTISTNLDGCP